jgi:hypothetical protein
MMPLLHSRIFSWTFVASFCSTIFWILPDLRTMRP